MYVLIDNYDSFTYNLFHYLGELGADVVVHRNDAIKAAADTRTPLLGVCLGHQALGQAMGGHIVRAPRPMHGKISTIRHDGTGVFADLPTPFHATRYHSLAVDRATLPNTLSVTAESEDGVIMGVAHAELPLHGVQFHPESIASENGHNLLRNFLRIAEKAKH